MISPKLLGSGWPAYLIRSGFGSNRSTWLGPPCMNSQITRLARGAKCGSAGARGFFAAALAFSPESNEASASIPAPPPAVRKKSRREYDIPTSSVEVQTYPEQVLDYNDELAWLRRVLG